jgi:hypothetical protein
LQAFAVNNKSKVSEFANRKRLRLGELLLDAGRISQKQLDEALAFQKKSGFRLGRSLTEVGAILEKDLHQFLAKQRARTQGFGRLLGQAYDSFRVVTHCRSAVQTQRLRYNVPPD